MATTKGFRDVSIAKAKKQSVLIDALTDETPILGQMPVEETSDGFHHVYEQAIDIDHIDSGLLDDVLTEVDMDSKLVQETLTSFAAKIVVGEDKAKLYPGGRNAYFAKKLPKILRATGNAMERNFYYLLRDYAVANGRYQLAGGSGSALYSIVAVTWTPQEVSLLYNPDGFGNGRVFDIMPISGGNIYEDANGRLVYGMRMKTQVGLHKANERYVSAICNIDASNLPTETEMGKLLLQARRNARTRIYCHPQVLDWLGITYKGANIQTSVGDTGYSNRITTWDSVPFVDSWNIKDGTETAVS
jgi:hypothetical protein